MNQSSQFTLMPLDWFSRAASTRLGTPAVRKNTPANSGTRPVTMRIMA